MTLIDCSGFSVDETKGINIFRNGYFCYQAPAPPPPPARPASAGAFFTVESGDCTTSNDGTCSQSPGYPDSYNDDERCTMSIHGTASLSSTHFDTESSNYDYITISPSSHKYGGSSGPDSIHVSSSTTVSWRTDGSGTGSGWEICLSVCDAECQALPLGGGYDPTPAPPPSGDAYDAGSMGSTLRGIVPIDGTITNPILASFVHYAATFQVGLYLSMLTSVRSQYRCIYSTKSTTNILCPMPCT